MKKSELAGLTGIRFYAALFVYLSHVAELIPGMSRLSAGSLFFNAGDVCVSFFFVLSGFILTYNYADSFRDGVSATTYKRFVWDRLTKIYPVHFLTLLIVLPIAIFSPHLPLDWRAVPFHLLMLQCFWPSTQPAFYEYLNVPSWSISCEWFFYLVAPIAMFLALGSLRRRWALVLMAAAFASGLGLLLWQSGSAYARLYFVSLFAPSRFLEFLAGVFLARVFFTASKEKLEASSGLAQLAGIALIVAGANYRAHAPWPLWGGLLYVPGSALLVLGLAYGRGFFVAHLSRPWLNRLGMASYSLYMIHAPILRAVKGVCMRVGWEVTTAPGFWVVAAGLFVVVQAGALIMCFAYEIPLQRRLRSLLTFPAGLAAAYAGQNQDLSGQRKS